MKIKIFNNFFLLSFLFPFYLNLFTKRFDLISLTFSYSIYLFLILYVLIFYNEKLKIIFTIKNFKVFYIILILLFFSSLVNVDKFNFISIFIPFIFFLLFLPFTAFLEINSTNVTNTFFKNLNYLMLPFIFYIFYLSLDSNNYIYGRLAPENLQPNFIGEGILVYIFTSIFYNKRYLKFTSLLAGFYLLFLLQSRGNLVSGLLFLFLFYYLRSKNKLIILLISAILAFLFKDFIISELLFLDNPYRGLDTNFTNRLDGWYSGIKIFSENIFFGTGYGTNRFIHNGYIRMYSELGIMLSFLISCILIRIIVYNFNKIFKKDILDRYFISIYLSYIFNYFFSTRYINLNIMSVFFFFIVINLIFNRKRNEIYWYVKISKNLNIYLYAN